MQEGAQVGGWARARAFIITRDSADARSGELHAMSILARSSAADRAEIAVASAMRIRPNRPNRRLAGDHSICLPAKNLRARRAEPCRWWFSARRPNQRDVAREYLVLIHHALANEVRHFGWVDLVALGALDLLHDNEFLVTKIAGDGKCSAAVWSQRRMHGLHAVLDILWVVIYTTDDDEILDPSGDEQFAVGIEESKVAGPQPVGPVIFVCDTRLQIRLRGVRIAPVCAGYIRAAHPDLADRRAEDDCD